MLEFALRGPEARTVPSGGVVRVGRAAALALALLAMATLARSATPSTLTLAVADNPYAAPVLIAESEGYFAAEGLRLKVIHCAFGRVCLQHLLDGQAHVATVADTPITLASFARRDFSIIATTTTTGSEHRMVMRSDRGLRTAADLKGRRIGMLAGTSAHYFAETFLTYHGIDVSQVTWVPLTANDASGALARGEVDAAALFDPHLDDALQRLGPQALALGLPGFFNITFNLVSVSAAAGVRDEDLLKLLRAVQRAMQLIHDDPVRARSIVARALGTDGRNLARTWSGFRFRLELAQPLVTTLEAQARWAVREKLVASDAPMPNYLEMIRTGPLLKLAPKAVRLDR